MMLRLVILVALLAVVALGTQRYRVTQRRDASVGANGLPTLPENRRTGTPQWLVLTTPYCVSCDAAVELIRTAHPGASVSKVDITDDIALGERYGVRSAPTVLVTDESDTVSDRIVGIQGLREHLDPAAVRT